MQFKSFINVILLPFKKAYKLLEFTGKKMATAVNVILLTLVYFTAFAATAVVAKALRKRFLDIKTDQERQSYWIDRKKEDHSKKENYRSF